MAESNLYTKVEQLINELTYAAFNAKVPITIYCIMQRGGKEEEKKSVVSPAAVEYTGNTTLFYDIQNVMSGRFTTTPRQSREEEEDPFGGFTAKPRDPQE